MQLTGRTRRLFLLAIVAAGLAPGTWLRSVPPPRTASQQIAVTQLAVPARSIGGLTLVGAWQLASRNADFGSYSALLALDNGRLLAVSDRGRRLEFSAPGGPQQPSQMGWFGSSAKVAKYLADIESVTSDPAQRTIWAGYEGSNSIMRLDLKTRTEKQVAPAAMADWSDNSGPEAMVRLKDGRFIVLSEALGGMLGREAPAVLFSGDPVEGAKAARFTFLAPKGYRATDMALLPDGRVLILVRKLVFALPPGFSAKIVLADPAEIFAGKTWRGKEVATIDDLAPPENYEAMAIKPDKSGALTVWVMSDDNNGVLQRTLLLKLRYIQPQRKP